MPCKNGTRENIEAGKRYHELRKQYNPFDEHWRTLVKRVHHTEAGFEGLTPDEKLYFAVNLVDLDVTNGGMHQYFSNSASNEYAYAIAGLERLGATHTLELLLRAKEILFGDQPVPSDANARWDAMKQYPEDPSEPLPEWSSQLEAINRRLWDDPDGLNDLLCQFAESTGMIESFRKPTDPE